MQTKYECEDCGKHNTGSKTVMYQGTVALCRNERACLKRQTRSSRVNDTLFTAEPAISTETLDEVAETTVTSTTYVYLIEKLPGSSDHWFPVGVVETREEAVRYVDKKNCGSSLSGDFYKYTEFALESSK